jgi:hypothetical protein
MTKQWEHFAERSADGSKIYWKVREVATGRDVADLWCNEGLSESDARLIAEAPAMLDLVQFLAVDTHTPGSMDFAVSSARAILARIDGTPIAEPTGPTAESISDPWAKTIALSFDLTPELGGGPCVFLSRYWADGSHIYVTCEGGGGMPSYSDWSVGAYTYDLEADEPVQIKQWDISDSAIGLPGIIRMALERIAENRQTTETLTDLLRDWSAAEGLEYESADEMLLQDGLTDEQRAFLNRFLDLWDKVQDDEDREQAAAWHG